VQLESDAPHAMHIKHNKWKITYHCIIWKKYKTTIAVIFDAKGSSLLLRREYKRKMTMFMAGSDQFQW